jgi:hypothetical protein
MIDRSAAELMKMNNQVLAVNLAVVAEKINIRRTIIHRLPFIPWDRLMHINFIHR